MNRKPIAYQINEDIETGGSIISLEPEVDENKVEKNTACSELNEARDMKKSSTVNYASENISDFQYKKANTTAFENLSWAIEKPCQSIAEKKCNELLLVLKNNALHIENRFSQFPNCATIQKYLTKTKPNERTSGELHNHDVLNRESDAWSVLMKDPQEAIRAQVSIVSASDFSLKSEYIPLFSHLMNAQIGDAARFVVERAVKIILNPTVIWKVKESDQVQSTVDCLQLYSDK